MALKFEGEQEMELIISMEENSISGGMQGARHKL